MGDSTRRTPKGADDQKLMNKALIGVGLCLVAGVTGLACAGTYSAVSAMNRQSDEIIAAAQAAANAQKAEDEQPAVVPENMISKDDLPEQILWMLENDVHYDEYGRPVDKSGKVVDDPTTEVYDPARNAYFFENDGSPKAPFIETLPSGESVKNEENTLPSGSTGDVAAPGVSTLPSDTSNSSSSGTMSDEWWLDSNGNVRSGLQLDDSGRPFYTVQRGDWLIRVADRYGFDYKDVAKESGISNPSLILPGDVLYFPDKVSSVSDSRAPGRG